MWRALGAGWCSGVPGAEKRPCAWHQDKEGSRVPKAVEMMQRGPSPEMVLTRDAGQPQVDAAAAAVGGAVADVEPRQTAAHSPAMATVAPMTAVRGTQDTN